MKWVVARLPAVSGRCLLATMPRQSQLARKISRNRRSRGDSASTTVERVSIGVLCRPKKRVRPAMYIQRADRTRSGFSGTKHGRRKIVKQLRLGHQSPRSGQQSRLSVNVRSPTSSPCGPKADRDRYAASGIDVPASDMCQLRLPKYAKYVTASAEGARVHGIAFAMCAATSVPNQGHRKLSVGDQGRR